MIESHTTVMANEANLETYIELIGSRVRALRAKRGMTRKDLSKHSEVSERYLAQLEAGKANITLAVLWRVAEAFDIPFAEMIPGIERDKVSPLLINLLANLNEEKQQAALHILKSRFNEQPVSSSGIALIGLRGAGKSTLGKELAAQYGRPFIRLTSLIEEIANMNVGEILDMLGQKKFRRIELQAVQQVLAMGEPVVLETGGSLVSQTDTFNLLLENFFSIWVKASPQEHLQRVISQGDMRPMNGFEAATEDLKLILEEREPEYRQADYVLDTEKRSEADCLAELSKVAGGFLNIGRSNY
ncbi:MAG: helix-turn-helix transcriptional regulator [Gammaproteobacteria bacterium]|nr:helix-turn-helix transcriptional regulator [Gammaproteobacteria bacterium]MCP4880779.1 helix-turn-helix transcriptional regulator [Gammaproteobacteria bacterium]MDP6165624.1 helix-turn-helix transcriptional regulator [Gammaproteobacteria bacterium]